MKVVINTCYGGFSLSVDAMMKYAARKGVTLYPFVRESAPRKGYRQWNKDTDKDNWIVYFATKPLVNGAYEKNSYWWPEIERNDPDLVSVVEKMGKSANGYGADLKVVEIPDDVEYTIEEYDGNEWIAEKHRTWR